MDEGGGGADAGMIVSDNTDGAEYVCKGSTMKLASYGTDSAEDNDNALDKEMTILLPSYVNTPDYNDVSTCQCLKLY